MTDDDYSSKRHYAREFGLPREEGNYDPEANEETITGICECGRMAEILVDDEGQHYYDCGHCGSAWPCEDSK